MKQIIPEGHNKEPAINWARYQFVVTQQRDHEAHSSSMYSMFDIHDQVVNFQSYIDDNDTIVDQVRTFGFVLLSSLEHGLFLKAFCVF